MISTVAIIAGGRDLIGLPCYFDFLEQLHVRLNIVEVVSGKAKGGDAIGEQFARRHDIKITGFPAQWKTEGKSAGPMRNLEMAVYASRFENSACILLPGGRGTASMELYALMHGLEVYKYVA